MEGVAVVAEVMLAVTEVEVMVVQVATLVEVIETEMLAGPVGVETDVVILSFRGWAGRWKHQKASLTWSEL